jgi:hypothetical protein
MIRLDTDALVRTERGPSLYRSGGLHSIVRMQKGGWKVRGGVEKEFDPSV